MKPLIFCPRSMRAWQAGQKTETRRLVRPQPAKDNWILCDYEDGFWWLEGPGSLYMVPVHQPYAVGDICWIREALRSSNYRYFIGNDVEPCRIAFYAADGVVPINQGRPMRWRWKRDKLAAIFMPRRAARYHATILNVRPERLQDISVEDAIAEGTLVGLDYAGLVDWHHGKSRDLYGEWWDSLYKKVGTRWSDNPWVWVYSLEPIDASEKQCYNEDA